MSNYLYSPNNHKKHYGRFIYTQSTILKEWQGYENKTLDHAETNEKCTNLAWCYQHEKKCCEGCLECLNEVAVCDDPSARWIDEDEKNRLIEKFTREEIDEEDAEECFEICVNVNKENLEEDGYLHLDK